MGLINFLFLQMYCVSIVISFQNDFVASIFLLLLHNIYWLLIPLIYSTFFAINGFHLLIGRLVGQLDAMISFYYSLPFPMKLIQCVQRHSRNGQTLWLRLPPEYLKMGLKCQRNQRKSVTLCFQYVKFLNF